MTTYIRPLRSTLSALRRRARHHAEQLGYFRLVWGSGLQIGYVGWIGKGNVGDEAILTVHRRALADAHLVKMPLTESYRILRRIDRLRSKPVVEGLLMGGGTLIGRDDWRVRIEELFAALGDVPASMLGVGVEDPDFDQPATDGRELSRWPDLLARFDRVTVRGPRSRDILASVGVEAVPVGDPALLLSKAHLDAEVEVEERLLGVNIAGVVEMWGKDPTGFLESLTSSLTCLDQAGWRIRLFPFHKSDIVPTMAMAKALGGTVEVMNVANDMDMLLRAIQPCNVFVGQRLHSVVLASAVYVPSVALEYRPKCWDFQASLGRQTWCVRTSSLASVDLLEFVDALSAERERHSRELYTAVAEKREKLEREVERIHGVLCGHIGRSI